MIFKNRIHAANVLAEKLERHRDESVVVMALPPGGVVLGAEIAHRLNAQLGLVLVSGIGKTKHSKTPIGAVVDGESPIYNAIAAKIDSLWLNEAVATTRRLISRRRRTYFQKGAAQPVVSCKTVILVDDGVSDDISLEAAIIAMRHKQARKVIVAVPLISAESAKTLKPLVDELIVLEKPRMFTRPLKSHYQNFKRVTSAEVKLLLERTHQHQQSQLPQHIH